jgi:hypothetical protein
LSNDILSQIEKCFPKPHHYQYEKRLVAYIDVLGWKNATNQRLIPPEVLKVLQILDSKYSSTTVSTKEKLSAITGAGFEPNPMLMDIECGIFSDGIVISKPEDFGARIFGEVAILCRKLLSVGFLCRGAITVGYCYHKENRIFGPAINRVVELEKIANFPRVICSDVAYLAVGAHETCITQDFSDIKVLNLFNSPVKVTKETINSIKEGLKIDIINDVVKRELVKIEEKINKFSGVVPAEELKVLEKWKYIDSLMKKQLQETIDNKISVEDIV